MKDEFLSCQSSYDALSRCSSSGLTIPETRSLLDALRQETVPLSKKISSGYYEYKSKLVVQAQDVVHFNDIPGLKGQLLDHVLCQNVIVYRVSLVTRRCEIPKLMKP